MLDEKETRSFWDWIVAETMKLLRNSSYSYQIMERSRYNNQVFFKQFNVVKKGIKEVELLKSTIEHKEPMIEGFLILHYVKLRMLELY